MASAIKVNFIGDAKNLIGEAQKAEGALGKFGKVALGFGAAAAGAFVGAGVGLFKLGESFDKQFDKIRVGTGATGEALHGLEGSFKNVLKNVPTDFDSAGTAIADLNTRLGLTGKPLEDLAGQFINLSRITKTDVKTNVDNLTRVFGDWGIATDKQAKSLDKVYRASQASGIGLEDLSSSVVQFGAPLRNLGFSFDDSLALLSQFNKTGVNTETVFAGLKAGVGKLAKAGEDVPATFKRVVKEITELGPGSEATAKAIELFGQRAGPDLADAIAGGKFELDGMLAAITGGSDTINGAAKDTESFGEKWQRIKNRVLVGLQPIAAKVFDGLGKLMDKLGPVMDKLGPKFERLAAWLNEKIPAAIAYLQPKFDAVMAWLRGNVPPTIDKVQKVFAALVDWWNQNMPPILKKLREMFSSAFGAVRAIVEKVIVIVTDLWSRFGDTVLNRALGIIDGLKQTFGGLVEILSGIFKLIKAILTGKWGEAWDSIKEIFFGAWHTISGVFDTMQNALALAWGVFTGTLSSVWFATWHAIHTFLADIWDKIKGAVEIGMRVTIGVLTGGMSELALLIYRHWDEILAFFKGVPGKIVDAIGDVGKTLYDVGVTIVTGFLDGVKWYAENVLKVFYIDLPTKVIGWIGDVAKTLYDKGKEILGGLFTGVADWWIVKARWFADLPGMILDKLGDVTAWLYETGKNIIKGLYNGIVDAPFNVGKAIADKVPGGSIIKTGIDFGKGFVPHLAGGGITTGRMLATIGDNPSGREAVIPLDSPQARSMLGGPTVHITVNAVDGRGAAEAVAAALADAQRMGLVPA